MVEPGVHSVGFAGPAPDPDERLHTLIDQLPSELADLRFKIDALLDQVALLVDLQSVARTSPGQSTAMDTQLTPLHEAEFKRLEDDSRAKVLQSLEMLTSSDAGRALGSEQSDPRRVASAWRRRGALLGLPIGRAVGYPEFQFDFPSHRIKPGVADANRLLNARDDPWGVASWWVSPSGWLDGNCCPLDLAVAGEDDTLRELARSVVGAA